MSANSNTTMLEPKSAGEEDVLSQPGPGAARTQIAIFVGVFLVLAILFGLYLRAAARTSHVALSQAPKPVSIQRSQTATFRPIRSYVGTTRAWNVAHVGPQYVSAYVGSVLVRPGAVVKRGDILATLDCRNASAASREIAARAKALEQRRAAIAHESERLKLMSAAGFASENEVEKLGASANAEAAEVESLRASLASKGLEVNDCVLRAPFTGEIADRLADPGAYARPSMPIVSVIDRSMIRVTADAPESDFSVVAPGTEVSIEVEASGVKTAAKISRRAPSADDTTRTVHFEIDLPNKDHILPAGATARLTINVGVPQPATSVPLSSATLRGDHATLFVVANGIAKRVAVPVLGELSELLYLDPKFPAGASVVVEGRALLDDGDHVAARELSR
jgi:RND family efflux transporter MFP subunit